MSMTVPMFVLTNKMASAYMTSLYAVLFAWLRHMLFTASNTHGHHRRELKELLMRLDALSWEWLLQSLKCLRTAGLP